MAQPTTQLNATEQDTLVKQIGLALLRAAPRDWRRITAQYRAVGRYHEMSGEVVNEDGSVGEWMATHDIATLFGRLRGGMYREGRGTWFNAKYQLDHPSSYNLEYDRDEPRWDLQPPPQAYADELRMFPRSEENVPDWLMRRMSGLGPEQPGPHFRIARIFDGQGADGQPIINRPEIDADEGERLFTYLNAAPVVLSERGLDLDRLAQPPVPKVPVAYHTDGTWIWPAATNYYLNEYGIAPEADLVAHVRSAGFTLTEVSDHTVQAASAYLNRGNQPPQVPPPPRPPAGTRPVPEQGPPPAATGESDPARASGEDYADSASDAPSAADATRPSKVPPAPDAAGPSDATRPEFGRESTRPEFGGERSGPRFGGAETAAAAGLAGAAAAAVGTAGAGAIRSALNHDDDDAPTDPGHRDYGREQGPAHGEDVAFDDDRPEPGRTDYGRELDQPEHGRPDFAHAEGGRPDTGRSDFVRGSEPPAHPEVEQPTTFTPVIDPDAGPPTEVQAAVTDEPEPEPPSEPAVPSAPFGAGPTATQLVPPVAKHRPEPGSPQADVARPRAEGAAQAPDQGEAGGRPPLEGSARRPEAAPPFGAAALHSGDEPHPAAGGRPESGLFGSPVGRPEGNQPDPGLADTGQAAPGRLEGRTGRGEDRPAGRGELARPDTIRGEPVIDGLRSRLRDLGVPASAYRIGEPAEHGWSMEHTDAGWRVGWYDDKLTNPAVFGDPEDAAAFMLGKLLLDPRGREASPAAIRETPPPPPARESSQPSMSVPIPNALSTGAPAGLGDTAPVNGGRIEEEAPIPPPMPEQPALDAPPTMLAPPVPPPVRREPPPPRREPARPAASAPGGGQWPIQPLPGEPPLTLFRGKEMRELPPGSELDRFGGPNGNLTYAAGTPFEERSLVPEWVTRPYHVYRVQRPLEALAGEAIPWFNQPGGGAAYLLPTSIDELVAEGNLIELDPGEPPID